MVKQITDATFNEETNSDVPVVVDFWAPWCGPCKMLGPLIEELASEMGDKVKFAKINVDENPITANTFRVASIPTLIIIKDGKVVDQSLGFKPKPALVAWIQKYL